MRVDWIYHSVVFGCAACIPIRLRWYVIFGILALPFLGELVQFWLPGYTPDIQDALVGASAAAIIFCLRIMYREIAPVVKRYIRRRRQLGL